MNNPTTGIPAGQPDRPGAPPGLESGAMARQGRGAVLSAPILGLRQLHYYLELLSAGHRQAVHPDASFRSLRAERIALGIDLPELDTVPLWASKRADGSVSIPFVEFILDQTCRSLDAIGRSAEGVPEADRDALIAARVEIGAILADATPDGETPPALPRLGDVYMPGEVLDRLCGPGGLAEGILQCCAAIVLRAVGEKGH